MLHSCCTCRGLADIRTLGQVGIYLKFNSKQSWDLAKEITSVQAPILGKRILQADKSDNLAIYHISSQIWQLLQDGMCSQALGKASGRASILVFPVWRRRQRSYALFYNVFFGHDFLSPHTTIVLGVENYPSSSMSCCFDDLAHLLPCLDF